MNDFEDEESADGQNDDINEYRDSEESDWEDEDEKVQILSKKQKQILAFQKLIRSAVTHFNNKEYLNFQQDLKDINNAIKINKWNNAGYKMPKFYVKHMLEIYEKILKINPKNEKNTKEQRALKSLKKKTDQQFEHIKQIKLFKTKGDEFWKGEDSDLGGDDDENMMNDEDDDDDGALIALQDANIGDDAGGDAEESADGGGDDDGDDDVDDDDFDEEWSDDEDWQGGRDDTDEDADEDEDDEDEDKANDEPGGDKIDFGSDVFEQEELKQMKNRSFWVQKNLDKDDECDKPKQDKKKKRKPRPTTKKPTKPGDDKKLKGPKPKDRKKWSVTKVNDIFSDVLVNRGKSAVNREHIIKRLEELEEQCRLHDSEQARLTVMSVLISFYFDSAERKTTGMSGSRWRKTRNLCYQLTKSLTRNINTLRMSNDADIRLILKDDASEEKKDQDQGLSFLNALNTVDENNEMDGDKKKDDDQLNKKDKKKNILDFSVINTNRQKKQLDSKFQWVHGNLLSFIRKLTVQLWTSLKALQPKSEVYEKRLKNTKNLVEVYKRSIKYFGKLNNSEIQSEIQVLWMSVIHSDYDQRLDELKIKVDHEKMEKEKKKQKLLNDEKKDGDDDDEKKQKDLENTKKMKKRKEELLKMSFRGQEILNLPKASPLVSKAKFVFENGTSRMQTEAMLYLIYNMAVHKRYELCRDLLLMSHLGSSNRIGQTNIELKILYNRTLAQFAICSFSHGHWYSTMIILQELYSSNRIKILLAQGYTKAPQDNPNAEQIKLEQIQHARMLPSHFHISHDILEASHLISSLFIEMPNMINNTYNRSFIRNQHFRRIWTGYLRRDLRVPPENTQTLILTTGIHIQNGQWSICREFIKKLKLWTEIKHSKYVRKKVLSTVKRECCRCYLYKFGSVYQTMSILQLAEMFDLSESQCKQFICKLIIQSGDKKFASLDELTNCIIIHQTPPMPIQRAALEYSDKLSFLIEQNEKLMGIYSRFGGGYGGGTRSGRWQNRNKNQDDSKGNDSNKNKNQQNKNRRNKFSNRGQKSSSNQKQNTSNAQKPSGSKFGKIQRNKTQLRPSVQPSWA